MKYIKYFNEGFFDRFKKSKIDTEKKENVSIQIMWHKDRSDVWIKNNTTDSPVSNKIMEKLNEKYNLNLENKAINKIDPSKESVIDNYLTFIGLKKYDHTDSKCIIYNGELKSYLANL